MKKEKGYAEYLFCFQGNNANTLEFLRHLARGKEFGKKDKQVSLLIYV